ncbi:ParA family protein [Rapidithrix thailandica]|uniref:ParA family protein n=1 Tax=Rapidithrix thailandica TaxID=413964 RepID=A0AAW9SCC9_9BACT
MSCRIISFATQKGGVGKTTLLMLTAAAIHNRTKKRVLVIDCDPQRSVKTIYNQENNNDSYDVFAFNWNQPKPEANFEKTITLAEKRYDVILMDVPGKMEGKEIYYSVLISDFLIVPVVASALDINATISFLKKIPPIREDKMDQGFPFEVYGVINKKDQTIEHQRLKELAGIGGMKLFYSPISNLVRYRRNISTVHDITDSSIEKDEFNMYFDEFMTKCLL